MPQVRASAGSGLAASFGVTITQDEVEALVRVAVSPAWIESQADALVDQVVAFVTGAEKTFALGVSLTEPKRSSPRHIRRSPSVSVARL